MIKLGGLITLKPITEADVFTATSKETGTTSVFKSKDARDAAIKAGTHEKRKDDKDGAVKDPTDKPKVNIFDKPKKDKAAKGGDSSAGEKDTTDYTKLTTTPLVKKTKDDIKAEEFQDTPQVIEISFGDDPMERSFKRSVKREELRKFLEEQNLSTDIDTVVKEYEQYLKDKDND